MSHGQSREISEVTHAPFSPQHIQYLEKHLKLISVAYFSIVFMIYIVTRK